MRARAPVLVLAFVLLAGCTSAPPVPDDPAPPDGTVEVVDAETGERRVLHAWEAAFAGARTWHNETYEGRFELGQHWDVTGQAQSMAGFDPGSAHVRDISELVPKNVPVRLTAEVNADLSEGDLDLWFNAPNDEVWTTTFDAPVGGYSYTEYVIVHSSDEPIEVVVFYDEPEPAQTIDYVLDVRVHAEPARLVGGVPIIVPVPRDAATLQVTFDGPGADLLLWAPDDTFIGRMGGGNQTLNHTIDTGGDFILLTPEGAPAAAVRIYAPGEAPRSGVVLRAAKQDIQLAATETVSPNTPRTVSYDAPKVPIQAGLDLRFEDVLDEAQGTFDGPDGNVFDYQIDGDVPWLNTAPGGTFGFTMLTDIGDARLAAGTYTGTLDSTAHGNGEIGIWMVYILRA